MEGRGEKLRQLRLAKKLDQRDVADAVGVKFQTVSDWERKHSNVAPRHHRALAGVLGQPVHVISEMYATRKQSLAELTTRVADLTALAAELQAEVRELQAERARRSGLPDAG